MWKIRKLIHGAKVGLVTEGHYADVKPPQYSGLFLILFLIMIGMLIQWPTIITALMFPALIFVYYRLSRREEHEMIELFGKDKNCNHENCSCVWCRCGERACP